MLTDFHSQAYRHTAAFLSLCVILTGCSMLSGGTKVHKSAKGSVYLEEVVDWSFEASHPAAIDQSTLAKVIKGLYADDSASAPSKLSAGGGKPMRIFSDEDAEFLAPLLAQSLSQAKPEQLVGFNVSSSAGSGAVPTAGTLYVQQGALHVTITPSQYVKAAGFTPASSARIEKAPSYAAKGASGVMSLVIDYQAVARGPMPTPMQAVSMTKTIPAAPIAGESPLKASAKQEPATPIQAIPIGNQSAGQPEPSGATNDEMLNKKLDELEQARDANEAKKTEIKMLRKELEWMKRELRERTDEIKAMQTKLAARKPAPKKKVAEARPNQ